MHPLYSSPSMMQEEFVDDLSNIKSLCCKIFDKASKTTSTVFLLQRVLKTVSSVFLRSSSPLQY